MFEPFANDEVKMGLAQSRKLVAIGLERCVLFKLEEKLKESIQHGNVVTLELV